MSALVFEVTQEQDGGFCAECLPENIFTQGHTWEALGQNVQEGIHVILQTETPGHQRLSVPNHNPLRVGTRNGIVQVVAAHKGVDRQAGPIWGESPLCRIP